ncbi:hypothetical protein RB595_002376 [Gaeumannomyces hyphopodioides]
MFLDCFKRRRRNRKPAAVEPAPHSPTIPQYSTIGWQIDDAAMVPAQGFLSGRVKLPTYGPPLTDKSFSQRVYVSLTTSDVLEAMRRGAYLARCVLFETARLHKPLISVGALRLSQDARVLDTELVDLDKGFAQGGELILSKGREQDLILKGEPFQKVLRIAKKSLLELEKTFNDQILAELKNGMQSKESVDYGQLAGKVGNTKNGLRKVYEEITITYQAEERKVMAEENQS